MDKGTLSNLASTLILATGVLLPPSPAQALILSAGLFALSGGITNTLAVKMLFDRVPGLIGSGVIPARFRDIRLKIKSLILEHFFSEEELRSFVARRAAELDWTRYVRLPDDRGGPVATLIESRWDQWMAPDSIRPIISAKVDQLMESSFGGFLLMVGKETIETEITGFVRSFLDSMKERVLDAASKVKLDPAALRVEVDEEAIIRDFRPEVDTLIDQKLQELDREKVKRMLEDVIRHHLGWLVVWGNVFGALLGLLAHAIR